MFPLCRWQTQSTLYKVLWQMPPPHNRPLLSDSIQVHGLRISRFFLDFKHMVHWMLSWVFFIFYFYIKFENLLGVERCLFVFVLDSQWKRAPPCHSNSPEAKLLSPDGEPTHDISFFVMRIIMIMMIIRMMMTTIMIEFLPTMQPNFEFIWL